MPSGLVASTSSASSVLRRLAPWAVVLLIGVLLVGILPIAQAQTGTSAADAIPIGTDGKFAGNDAATTSLWYKFNYIGGNQAVTVTVTFEPADSNRLDIFLFTGDPANPTPVGGPSSLNNNVRGITYSDPGGPRVVLIKVENDHPDRTVSFVGALTPLTVISTPTPTSATNPGTPPTTPTTGPVASSGATAILIATNNGIFSGTLAPGQAVWYRFYYGNPGADGTVSITVAPSADNSDLNLYTGTDPNNLGPTQQGGGQARNGNTISRHVNAASPQFVFFSLANNGSEVKAYGGNISPFVAPPPTMTPTALATGTATPGPTVAPTATPTPVVVQPAPAVTHDAQYYLQTGYRVDDQAVSFFQSRGAVDTFGYPISRLFTFLGCPVQMYQRLIIQLCPGAGPQLINLLDPDIFPYTRVNGSVFPTPDDSLKQRTPAVGTPEYANILSFIQTNTPDTFNGQPVNFWQTFMARGGLEILGAPISQPQADPTNSTFIYMRFQRVILHFHPTVGGGTITEPLLLADYLKQIILGPSAPSLPQDLSQQASGSRFYAQYCRGGLHWLCRPDALGGTDLTFAFEQG
ncbi:MAG TPA: hypothetical protein VKV73_20425 [Chloroflexota bacterium]|nr:hypothetical protein [Chloroflexota bacterium]